jgi:hypothetical protein
VVPPRRVRRRPSRGGLDFGGLPRSRLPRCPRKRHLRHCPLRHCSLRCPLPKAQKNRLVRCRNRLHRWARSGGVNPVYGKPQTKASRHPLRRKDPFAYSRKSNRLQATPAAAIREGTQQIAEQPRRKGSATRAVSPSIQGLAMNHQIQDANRCGIRPLQRKLDAIHLLKRPRPVPTHPPLTTPTMPLPIDADSGARLAGHLPVE